MMSNAYERDYIAKVGNKFKLWYGNVKNCDFFKNYLEETNCDSYSKICIAFMLATSKCTLGTFQTKTNLMTYLVAH